MTTPGVDNLLAQYEACTSGEEHPSALVVSPETYVQQLMARGRSREEAEAVLASLPTDEEAENG